MDRENDMLKEISIIYRKTQIYLTNCTHSYNLSSSLASFLIILCEKRKMTQTQFCGLLDMSKGNVAKVLNKLEELGYVTRQANPFDSRSVDVFPTERAQEVYPLLIQSGKDWSRQMTKDMTDMERTIFFQLLKRVCDNIGTCFEEHVHSEMQISPKEKDIT